MKQSLNYEQGSPDSFFYEWGTRLRMTPTSITLDDGDFSYYGDPIAHDVTVHHDGSRAGYKRAWSIARRLLHSDRSRPAYIYLHEIAGIKVRLNGAMAYALVHSVNWNTAPTILDLDYQPSPQRTLNLTYPPAA